MREQLGGLQVSGQAWWLRYRSPRDDHGRRHHHRVRIGSVADFPTYELARAEADRIILKLCPPSLLPGTSPAWATWCATYRTQELPLLRRGSASTYRSIIENHVLPSFDGLHVHQIDLARIQQWISRQAEVGIPAGTVRVRYQVLRAILAAAVRAGLTATMPPPRSIRLPRMSTAAQTELDKAFSPAERDALLAAQAPTWLKCLFAVLAFTGCRIGEACALSWQHVDLQRREIRIRGSASLGEVRATKTGRSVREIPINDRLLVILTDYQREAGRQAGLLFPNRDGKPRSTAGIRLRHLVPMLRALGIPEQRSLHAFRHRFCSDALASGMHPEAVQRLMGHSDLRTTSRYAHSSWDDRIRAVQAVGDALKPTGSGTGHADQ